MIEQEGSSAMKWIRLLGASLAFMAFRVLSISAASAEFPEILPTPTPSSPMKFTSISDTGSEPIFELTKGEETRSKCKDLTSQGQFTSARLGVITIDFLGQCEVKKAKCKSEGDVAGTFLVEGDIHLVDVEIGTGLRLSMAFVLPKDLLLTCGVAKAEIRGAFLGLASEVTSSVKTKHLTLAFNQSKGEQELKECKLDKAFCEGKNFGVESNLGEGFELSALDVKELLSTEKEVEVHF
jgi:hypothetical protein